jgi:hypothetical protein
MFTTFILAFTRDVVGAGIAEYSDGLDARGSILGRGKKFVYYDYHLLGDDTVWLL